MSSKRARPNYGSAYRDRIPLEDDYETVNVRSGSCAGPNGHPKDSAKTYVHSAWTIGTSWAPEDNYEYSLDTNDGWFDEALEAEVGDVMDGITVVPKQKKPRKEASVSGVTRLTIPFN